MPDRLLRETNYTVMLGDVEYKLAPINLNVLADIEDEFGRGLESVGKLFAKKQASTIRTLLWILIKNNGVNVTITREAVGIDVKLGDMASIAEKINQLITNSVEE